MPISIKEIQLRNTLATLSYLEAYYSARKGGVVLEFVLANNTSSAITVQPEFMITAIRNDSKLYSTSRVTDVTDYSYIS